MFFPSKWQFQSILGVLTSLTTAFEFENCWHNLWYTIPPNSCKWQVRIIYQWLFLVPVEGGRWHIIPQLAVYTTYILPSGGLYATYHLLREPETTIEYRITNYPSSFSCRGLLLSKNKANKTFCSIEIAEFSSLTEYENEPFDSF